MSNEKIKNREIDRNIATFEDYRKYCDTSSSYRFVGVLSDEDFQRSLIDPRTLFLKSQDGISFPFIVPIEYEGGYDAGRCENLTNASEVSLLALPIDQLDEDIVISKEDIERLAETAVLIEVADGIDPEVVAKFANRLKKTVCDIDDPRIHKSGRKSAAFSVFEFSVVPGEGARELAPGEQSFWEAWGQFREIHGMPNEPSEDSNDTYIFSGEQLADSKEMQQALWRITKHGFGEVLGAYHPVSMEEGEEFFIDHLTAAGTIIAVKHLNGEPVCFGSVSAEIANYPWINPARIEQSTRGPGFVVFSEVISGGEKGQRLAPDVTKTITDVFALTGKDYRVMFESTNFSEGYIPPITTRTIRESLMEFNEPIRKSQSIKYQYIK